MLQVADDMVYSALHTVLMSWGDVRPAVAALAEASQSDSWSLEEISATATNTLKMLGQQGDPRADTAAWRYFDALVLHDIVDGYHINTMLGLCSSSADIEKVLGAAGLSKPLSEREVDGEGLLLDARDQELTYELASRAWLRLGDVDRAASVLAEASAAAGGWGKKKLRRKVVATLRTLYEEAARCHDDGLHRKAQAYFYALHGRGLTDQHSCKLALRWCHEDDDDGSGGNSEGPQAAALRDAMEAAGVNVDGVRPRGRRRRQERFGWQDTDDPRQAEIASP